MAALASECLVDFIDAPHACGDNTHQHAQDEQRGQHVHRAAARIRTLTLTHIDSVSDVSTVSVTVSVPTTFCTAQAREINYTGPALEVVPAPKLTLYAGLAAVQGPCAGPAPVGMLPVGVGAGRGAPQGVLRGRQGGRADHAGQIAGQIRFVFS